MTLAISIVIVALLTALSVAVLYALEQREQREQAEDVAIWAQIRADDLEDQVPFPEEGS